MKTFLTALGILFGANILFSAPAFATDAEENPVADVDRAYADKDFKVRFEGTIRVMGQGGDAERRAGLEKILSLLTKTLRDEQSGVVPFTATPFWGGGSENRARSLRHSVYGKIRYARFAPDMLEPLSAWILDNDANERSVESVLAMISQATDASAQPYFQMLIKKGTRFPALLRKTLSTIEDLRLEALLPVLEPLLNDPRQSVREHARSVAEKLGRTEIPTFHPESAFPTELIELLENYPHMLFAEVPRDAKFARLEHDLQIRPHGPVLSAEGWMVESGGRYGKFLDVFGEVHEFSGERDRVTPISLKQKLKELVEVRKVDPRLDARRDLGSRLEARQNRAEKFSRWGTLSAQFEHPHFSVPEMSVAARLYAEGDKLGASEILFPALDGFKDSRELKQIVQSGLGNLYHIEMVESFQRRDYLTALELAKHLSEPPFDGYRYQGRAKELAAQLERRGDDFRDFSLPEPADWETKKKSLSVAEQVQFLAPRLRLLNCYQMGQPGALRFEDPQSGSPRPPWRAGEPVINPFNELGVLLDNPENIFLLADWLDDKNYLPSVGYGRSFHPSRQLPQVREIVATLINQKARGLIIDLGRYADASEAERGEMRNAIAAWSAAHRGVPVSDLLLQGLYKTQERNHFRQNFSELAAKKDPRLIEVAIKRYRDFDIHLQDVIGALVYQMNVPEGSALAREWLGSTITPPPPGPSDSSNREERNRLEKEKEEAIVARWRHYWGSIILTRNPADRDEGFRRLDSLLKDDREALPHGLVQSSSGIVDDFLSLDTQTAESTACRFGSKTFGSVYPTHPAETLRKLFNHSCPEVLDYFVSTLAEDSTSSGGMRFVERKGKLVGIPFGRADSLVEDLLEVETDRKTELSRFHRPEWAPKRFRYSIFLEPKARRRKFAELSEWLKVTFGKIERGELPPLPTKTGRT